jgi:conjugative relaxase-like TrwC/TraI family protein
MLRVTRLAGTGGGRAAYYLADLAPEVSSVATLTDSRASPLWLGCAAPALGLTGPVDPDSFTALLEDRGPGGRSLTAGVTPVAAWDLTFACPKSVSVLFGVGHGEVPGEVVAAHESAVRVALDYVETTAVAVRRGSGDERHLLPTGGVAAASFTHGLSRALDPHLHSHVVVANLARGEDGRWTAIDGRGLHAHAAAAGALYDCHLRADLVRRLGVAWEPPAAGASPELRGVGPDVRAEFSQRHAEIRSRLWEWQARSPGAARAAWAATRDAKPAALDVDRLAQQWVGRAESAGLVPAALDRVTEQRVTVRRSAGIDEHRLAAALWVSVHAAPTRRDVVAAWAGATTQGVAAREVLGAVEAWAPSRGAVGVEEPHLALRTVVPGAAVLATLGPRPVTAAEQVAYRTGAAAIETYRRRWDVTDGAHALGVDGTPASLAALPARRLADHLEVERTLHSVGRALGRDVEVRGRGQGLGRGRAIDG